jgi:hypothetical protein
MWQRCCEMVVSRKMYEIKSVLEEEEEEQYHWCFERKQCWQQISFAG